MNMQMMEAAFATNGITVPDELRRTANGQAKRRGHSVRVMADRWLSPRMRFVMFSIATEMLTFVPVHMFMEKMGII